MEAERNKYNTINFEETELRLGLRPLSSSSSGAGNHELGDHRKRVFSDTSANSVDLKLNLSNSSIKDKKNLTTPVTTATTSSPPPNDPAKPPSKAQVVGWPPVRSFRRNIVSAHKTSNINNDGVTEKTATTSNAVDVDGVAAAAAFVKVSMDGAPYLRKVDLRQYKSYRQLSDALAKMFGSFAIGKCGSQHGVITKDFMNESKLIDLLNSSEYVPTYVDKDGDWMVVGDVPWEMFVESCKRLRIMKGSEAMGLAPRAVEKCKSRG